jgi:hypothetical protein
MVLIHPVYTSLSLSIDTIKTTDLDMVSVSKQNHVEEILLQVH